MKEKTIALAAIIALFLVIFYSCKDSSANERKESIVMSNDQMVQRGSYLVNSMGCDDCHSPKQMGPNGPEVIEELRLSGYPSDRPFNKVDTNVVNTGWMMFGPDLTNAAGPWGESFAANLTPDSTGIGNWKEEQFVKAIREGKYKGLDNTRPLLPPMPWFAYKNLNDEDIKSIFAYLKSLKPVKNVVPVPKAFSTLN